MPGGRGDVAANPHDDVAQRCRERVEVRGRRTGQLRPHGLVRWVLHPTSLATWGSRVGRAIVTDGPSAVGVDIGGTKIAAGVTSHGLILARRQRATEPGHLGGIERAVIELVDELRGGAPIAAVGVAAAGSPSEVCRARRLTAVALVPAPRSSGPRWCPDHSPADRRRGRLGPPSALRASRSRATGPFSLLTAGSQRGSHHRRGWADDGGRR